MKLKFWGTRALISSPSKDTKVYGGNTGCLQIIYDDALILVGSGYGATNLGEELMDRIIREKKAFNIHIFISNFHWDHIQGLPFFQPIYFKSSHLHIYSPMAKSDLYEGLNVLFNESYSPFEALNKMPANVSLYQMQEELAVGGLKVRYVPLDRSETPSFGYRFDSPNGESVVVASANAGEENKALIQLSSEADLLVLGGLFTEAEYKANKAWGFASLERSLKLAMQAKAHKVLLSHHHPLRRDSDIVAIKEKLVASKDFGHLEFDFAQEQTIYEVL